MSDSTAESNSTTPPNHHPSDRVLIDKQHPEVFRAQLGVAKALRAAVSEAGFERKFAELLNVRVSQINGCAYCLDVHTAAALAAGESSQRLAILPAWRETELFSDRERAALTLAESITTLPSARLQDENYAAAAAVLTEAEISTVSWLAIAMNAFNRISITSRHRVQPRTA